jgi:hypothetical protein
MNFVTDYLADFGRTTVSDADVAAAESFAVATEVFELVTAGKSYQEAIEEFSSKSSLQNHEIAEIVESELSKLGITPAGRETVSSLMVVASAVAEQQDLVN